MNKAHGFAIATLLATICFLAWLAQRGGNDEKLFFSGIGLIVVVSLIGFLALLAKGENEKSKGLYFGVIGTPVGLVGGLAGGVAIGNQAGETAADNVKTTVEKKVEQVTQPPQ